MGKGQLKIDLGVIAVAAFVAAIFDWIVPLALIIGVALIVEKNGWLNQQVLEAGVLYVAYRAVVLVIDGWLFGSLGWLFNVAGALSAANVVFTIGRVFATIFTIIFLFGAIWAIVNLIRGKDARVPQISGLVKKFIAFDAPPEVI